LPQLQKSFDTLKAELSALQTAQSDWLLERLNLNTKFSDLHQQLDQL
jgi:chromosome segregation ATPase